MNSLTHCLEFKTQLDSYHQHLLNDGEDYFISDEAVMSRKLLTNYYSKCKEYISKSCESNELSEPVGNRKVNLITSAIGQNYKEAKYCCPKVLSLLTHVISGKSYEYEDSKEFEKKLRTFIDSLLTKVYGNQWITNESVIPESVRKNLEKNLIQHDKRALCPLSHIEQLEYFDFSDYENLILYGKNFDLFRPYLGLSKEEKSVLTTNFLDIRAGLRNPIAHNRTQCDPILHRKAEIAILWFERAFQKLLINY